ncbi:DUF4382 domain-containing protein [Arcicella sp. LKC2W]|uniref:DUF4382 domain-containing protein n=1 Tax=Arcicella sp. LKC2W TaxID=2984198 RepID=UPI002B21E296|nr:DUF4382 domain-containing protein [Arcicella sp. LKC2W]MEA5457945.1 DUF4382 domain-containing protein [Arcicella sp. LKC2W]
MIKLKQSILAVVILMTASVLQSCNKNEDSVSPDDNTTTGAKGTINVEITDAPSDDANVKGTFVTVTEVRIDGKKFSGFNGKKTIELSAYQNGNVAALGLGNIQTGTYNNISLILDNATDQNGNAPGCYALATDNTKYNLTGSVTGQTEVVSSKAFEVKENQQTNLVLDFDIRKAVMDENGSAAGGYRFVSSGDLNASTRVLVKTQAGAIKGNCANYKETNSKLIVYAYKKGTYNATETKGQGSGNVQFKNAETSCVADGNGNYNLAFLEEGDYELRFANYKNTGSGQFTLQSMANINSLISLSSISVKANASVTLNVTILGFLSL